MACGCGDPIGLQKRFEMLPMRYGSVTLNGCTKNSPPLQNSSSTVLLSAQKVPEFVPSSDGTASFSEDHCEPQIGKGHYPSIVL